MRYVIGVDQGNSKTWAAVADERGRILGTGLSGGGYATRRMAEAMQTLRESVGQALALANLQPQQVNVLYGGISSVDWPDEYEFVRQHVAAQGLAGQVYVTNDTIVALRGGTSAPYGAIIVAGTGANCGIRAPGGETFLYHYYVESELQGGKALGQRVLKAIYRAEHGREKPTALTGAVLARFGFASVDDLLRADCEGRFPPENVKQLAPLLFTVATAGDEVAQAILRSFGHGLAEMVTAGKPSRPWPAIPWCWTCLRPRLFTMKWRRRTGLICRSGCSEDISTLHREGTKNAKDKNFNNLSALCPTGRLRSVFAVSSLSEVYLVSLSGYLRMLRSTEIVRSNCF